MRRKHLILASCIISALLLTFTFHVSADENVTADAGASSDSAPLLDSYFWDNYYLLPYIESNGSQYINTGIILDSDSVVRIKFSPTAINRDYNAIFGSYSGSGSNNRYNSMYVLSDNSISFSYDISNYSYNTSLSRYSIFDCIYSNDFYINGELLNSFTDNVFSSDYPCYIFARNTSEGAALNSYLRLYSFSIYDSSLSDPLDDTSDPVGYVRYYYPAKSKSGDVIGLYDAISKTFVTTGGSSPFVSPTDDKVIHFQIGDFIESGLGWIGDILEFAIEEPMILMFMAIGLCGVAFRWARRVVHF